MAHDPCSTRDMYEWELRRKFVSRLVHRDGSFLDVGCANGMFIHSLRQWSAHDLDVYGIDHDADFIADAKQISADLVGRVAHLSGDALGDMSTLGLPIQYDFVYRSYWTIYDIEPVRFKTIVSDLCSHVVSGGRLIIGMYGSNQHLQSEKDHAAELTKIAHTIDRMRELIPGCSALVWADEGRNNVAFCLDV